MTNIQNSIEKGLSHLRFSQIQAAKAATRGLVRAHAVDPYMLAAVAYSAGEMTGKRAERQRARKREARQTPPRFWNYLDTDKGRQLWKRCTESSDMMPYYRAKAAFDFLRDAELGVDPPPRRADRPIPAESYARLIERDLPRVSDKLSSVTQTLAMLHDALRTMAAREAAKVDLTDHAT